MGLDMYLTRRKYIGGNYEHNKVQGVVAITKNGKQVPIDLNKVTYINEEVGYWRKANQIHKWFVDNVQDGKDDCGTYDVYTGHLEKLLELCKEVRSKAKLVFGKIKNGQQFKNGKWEDVYVDGKYIENAEEISKILPTEDGFFFGSTDYDEWYYSDIIDTIQMLEKVLKEDAEYREAGLGADIIYEYHSSW